MATRDDLVPPRQSEPLNDLVSSTDRAVMKLAGRPHRSGRRFAAQRELWPRVVQWLGELGGKLTVRSSVFG